MPGRERAKPPGRPPAEGGHRWPPAVAAIPARTALVDVALRRFLILHTTGRRSGQPRKTPLSYTKDGDTYIVIASDGGSPHHPDWYLNLQDDPEAEVDVGGHRSRVHAETVTGDERGRLWRQAVGSYGGYAGYQARTDRQIPVVRLSPTPST
ncbi:MAG TPA: nitroreductase family deazaflavin-dependent oxidoreductase [Desertimonas sp.]|nr:nitroreductase family deazaflavin-dependent oxidoreductase [Desertimonas sp.]